jgi:hypothetical protein
MFNMICRYDDFLNKKECDNLIDVFNNNIKLTKTYKTTRTLDIIHPDLLEDLTNKLKFYDFKNIDKMQIVLWEKNMEMPYHYDTGDVLSFIVYLNNNYRGGETIIDDIKITPKTGRLVLFSNGFYLHKVNKIKNKKRYTLIGWYK